MVKDAKVVHNVITAPDHWSECLVVQMGHLLEEELG